QRLAAAQRRDFWVYVDEFQDFITPSLAELLTGARKYRVGLTLAHQELRQLERDREVAGAVLGSTGTRVVFRVGDDDARRLAEGFAHFTARDLQNLATGHAVVRAGQSDHDFNLVVPSPEPVPEAEAAARRQAALTASRAKFGPASEEPPPEPSPPPPPEPGPPSPPKGGAAEVPKPEPVVPAEPAIPTKPPARAAAELGKGGEQHRAIQTRLKEAAETLGFRAVVEMEIPGGGSVDLFLQRGTQTFACEVSVTNTLDYEVGNVRKCLQAGFPNVVVVSPNGEKLRKLEAAVRHSLGAEETCPVAFFLPDDFARHLAALKPPSPDAVASETTTKGYKVRRKYEPRPAAERQAVEEAAIRSLAAMLKPPANPG
ncbi:MAG TPA: type IV secretory system conjugative DNA transfer family protein, partial [Verrucomicrobiota bacterium]|nr:type IV secretory system conjugative DNA transfer family protein [Verrucomicrobiota bacterium]